MTLQRAREECFWRGLFWIIREKGGSNGGWPPREIGKVSGWAVVRLLAAMSDRSAREVADQVIRTAIEMDKAPVWEESKNE